MTITPAQIDALRHGDRVRVTGYHGATVEGPVIIDSERVAIGEAAIVRFTGGSHSRWTATPDATLTVIEQAAPPLYVNHERTEPGDGDVARREGEVVYRLVGEWGWSNGLRLMDDPRGLTLLIDGATGQIVPQPESAPEPVADPMCECGHPKSQHGERGTGWCRVENAVSGDAYGCFYFRAAS